MAARAWPAATARLTEWIALNRPLRRRGKSARSGLRWPEPSERFETRPAADRQVVTSSREFVRGYPYAGYAKSVYEVNTFDAFSSEFVLADLFEKSARCGRGCGSMRPFPTDHRTWLARRAASPTHRHRRGRGELDRRGQARRGNDLARGHRQTRRRRRVGQDRQRFRPGPRDLGPPSRVWSPCSASTSWEALKSGGQVHR